MSGDSPETVQSRLRKARELAGLSQGQTARLLGVARPTISEIEAGRRKVSAEELATFAQTYDVDANWLLGQETEMNPALHLIARKLSGLSSDDIELLLDLLRTLNTGKDLP